MLEYGHSFIIQLLVMDSFRYLVQDLILCILGDGVKTKLQWGEKERDSYFVRDAGYGREGVGESGTKDAGCAVCAHPGSRRAVLFGDRGIYQFLASGSVYYLAQNLYL